jgi:hypothetical protein
VQVAAKGEKLLALAVLPLMARIALVFSAPQQDGLGSETRRERHGTPNQTLCLGCDTPMV